MCNILSIFPQYNLPVLGIHFCGFATHLKEIQFSYFEKTFFAAKGDTGKRTGPQVPNNHEKPCQKIRHSGGTKIETKKPIRRMKGNYKDVDRHNANL